VEQQVGNRLRVLPFADDRADHRLVFTGEGGDFAPSVQQFVEVFGG